MVKRMKKSKLLWQLFSVFFKIGLFTFGGGYAMISIIEDACVDRRGWITKEEIKVYLRVFLVDQLDLGDLAFLQQLNELPHLDVLLGVVALASEIQGKQDDRKDDINPIEVKSSLASWL